MIIKVLKTRSYILAGEAMKDSIYTIMFPHSPLTPPLPKRPFAPRFGQICKGPPTGLSPLAKGSPSV